MIESLKLVKLKLQHALNLYPFSTAQIPNSVQLIINNLSSIKEFVSTLESINLFPYETQVLRNSIVFTTAADSVNAQSSEASQIIRMLDNVKPIIENVINVLNVTLPPEQRNSINIKLPDVVKDFDSLSKVSNDLNIAISQILLTSDLECETKIGGVENGSIWINILLLIEDNKLPACITLITTLIGAAIKYRKTYFEGSLIKEQYLKLKSENDKLNQDDEIAKTLDTRAKNVVEVEAKQIQEVYFINSMLDSETFLRIKNSINTIAEWQDKGMIITPSIAAPQEDKDHFPTISQTQLLENSTKEIGTR